MSIQTRSLRTPRAAAALASLVIALAACSAPVQGQGGHEHGAHSSHAAAPVPVTAAARAQLAAARAAVQELSTPAAARAAGYRPMFGNVPLQGEHFVRVDLVLGAEADVKRPSVLMFAPVKGTPTLVGAAYAYVRDSAATPPALFDRAEGAWHAHEKLAGIAGKHIVMMHTWFVDAPEGPFARYNPWLPYYAAGLTPPPAGDSAADARARRLGMALSIAEAPPLVFRVIVQRSDSAARAAIVEKRATLAAIVPKLVTAERAKDRAAYQRLAGDATREADALVALLRRAAGDTTLAARLVDRTVDEFMGRGHGVEEELGALLGGRRPGGGM